MSDAQCHFPDMHTLDRISFPPKKLRIVVTRIHRFYRHFRFVIQKMVIEAVYSGTISAAPPIVSRAFQELSNGMVILNNVRKIKEIPFPFAFAQMQVVLLVCHLAVTATMSVFFVSQVWAVIVSFLITFSVWLPHFVALELEMPFGKLIGVLYSGVFRDFAISWHVVHGFVVLAHDPDKGSF